MECWQVQRACFVAPFREAYEQALRAFDDVNTRHYPEGSLRLVSSYTGALGRLDHEHDLQQRHQALIDDPSYRRALHSLYTATKRLQRMESRHRVGVRTALRAGFDVPPEVCAEYPSRIEARHTNK